MDDRKQSTAAGLILATLCAGQFLMMLDSSVMNVSMATVARDVDTSVTGIQTAITLYTLVMAAFMITGGKIGQIIGRSRAFAIGCVIYGAGSLTTALALEPGRPADRLVLPRGARRRPDPARRSSPSSPPTSAARNGRGLRPGRGGGRGGGRRRADRRRPLHHLPVLALRLRRRGRRGRRDPLPGPPDQRRRGREEGAARPRRHRALGGRARADRLRRPALGDLGIRPGEARRPRLARPLADDLAAPRRRPR